MSKYKVVLSEIAELQLQSILNYLEIEWFLKARNEFLLLFMDLIQQISSFPYSCPEYDEMIGIHKGTISKQTSLFYRFNNRETIEVIFIFDNRQDPSEIEKNLNSFK